MSEPNPADSGLAAAYPGVFYPGQVYPGQPFDQVGIKNWQAAYGTNAPHVVAGNPKRSVLGIRQGRYRR